MGSFKFEKEMIRGCSTNQAVYEFKLNTTINKNKIFRFQAYSNQQYDNQHSGYCVIGKLHFMQYSKISIQNTKPMLGLVI